MKKLSRVGLKFILYRGVKFTLVELLIVIAIIMILMSMLLPALKKTRELSKRLACINNEKAIGQGVHMYVSDNQGYVPMNAGFGNTDLPGGSANGWTTNGEWQEYLAGKYLSYKKTTDKGVFICPTHESPWNMHGLLSSYGFNYWIQSDTTIKLFQATKPSKLLMLGDAANGRYLIRGPIQFTGSVIHCRHNKGANLTFLDAHVQWIYTGDLTDYNAADPFWVNL